MIELLARIRAAERAPGPGRGAEGRRALKLLEWSRITDQIARRCLNPRAAERVRERLPLADADAIALRHALADELRPAGDENRWPPLADISAALDLIDHPPPIQLDGGALVAVAAATEALAALRRYLFERRETLPLWGQAAAEAAVLDAPAAAIRRALDRDGSLRDDASPLLQRLRRECARREREVRATVEAALADARSRGWTTAPAAALRGERYCLPLRSGDARKVPGIVHDRSGSGQTLFVEPAAVVQGHNELTEARLAAAAEEQRILLELNRLVEDSAPQLRAAAALLLLVDEVRAALLWSRDIGGARPRLVPQGALRLCAARHPLLWEQAAARSVVPLDLEPPESRRVVVISGPNAGGKSVALKTVGVCCLLAQCGWDVPAREDSRLPLFTQVLVDLGDEQSIAQSLSSFAAHLRHLSRFLRSADDRTLVLCDEIGSGTDPQEGTALAFVVLEELAARGAAVLASTHFGLLKAAVADHEAMINAAMDFDDATLEPLFTLRLGVPGSSHAFDIAARWNLPPELLQRARARLGEERVELEKLLADMQQRTRELEETRRRLAEQEAASERDRRELACRLAGFAEERRAALQETRQRGEELLREGRREIERAVREIRTAEAAPVAGHAARQRLEELAKRLPTVPTSAPSPQPPGVGDTVRIPHLGLTGRVIEVRGDRLMALADGLRLSLDTAAVEVVSGAEDAAAAASASPGADPASGRGGWRWHDGPPEISPEIDLRGERAEEGWEKLDRLIDRAIPVGLTSIRVVHGVGTGRLRAYLWQRLQADPRVTAVRPAGPGPGQPGATLVELKRDEPA